MEWQQLDEDVEPNIALDAEADGGRVQ